MGDKMVRGTGFGFRVSGFGSDPRCKARNSKRFHHAARRLSAFLASFSFYIAVFAAIAGAQ
ncbi:MAG: hypothetical protein ACREP5_16375, partial [Candidatus Binatia bacterium]